MLIKPLRDATWASRNPRRAKTTTGDEEPRRQTRNNFLRGKKVTIEITRWSSHPYFFINGDLDFRVIKALEYELSYFVEGYEKTNKFKEGRWNGQECLLYKSKKGTRFFPAGLLGTVSRVLSDFEVDYLVQDIKLSDVRKKYKSLALTWTGPELRDYQKKAVLDIMNNEGGTVCLPTGSGKTVVMLRIAYEYNLPFIVVVHTKELLYQWEKNIKTYFNGRCPGLVGDGYYNIEPITIAMMQTLSQKIVKDKIENLNFPIFVADECLPYDSVIITENGNMRIGDIVRDKMDIKVLTHNGRFRRITDWMEKPSFERMVRVNHDRGFLKCTEGHKILTIRGWIRSKDLTCGDTMYYYNDVQMQDMWEGVRDRGCVGRSYEYSSYPSGTQRACNPEVLGGCSGGSQEGQDCERVGNVEETVRANPNHPTSDSDDTRKPDGRYEYNVPQPEKSISEDSGSSRFETVRVRNVEILGTQEYNNNSSEDVPELGIRRFYDIVCHTEPAMPYPDIQSGNVEFGEEKDNRSVVARDNKSDCARRVVNGRRLNFERCDYVLDGNMHNGRGENGGGLVERSVGGGRIKSVSSPRDDVAYNEKRIPEEVCESRETLYNTVDGVQNQSTVFNITVEDDHSYVADNIVVKNCHRVPSETMYAVSMRCNAPVRIGLSATPTRTDGAQLKIFAACGDIKCKISPDELIKSGVLAKPKFEFLTPSGMYIPRGTKYFDAYLSGIVLNESRNNLIVKKALEYVAQKHTVYIHVERIDHGELLQARIPGSVFLSGKDGATKRQGVLRKFSKGEIPVLVSTLLKEGVDIPTISVFIAAGAGKSEIAVIQKAGRALRVAPGKTEAIIVDFRDSGRYLADHWAERYNTYKTVFGDYVPDV